MKCIHLQFLLLNLAFQVARHIILLFGSRDDPRRIGEEVIHLLERPLTGLGQQQPEEDSVGEVTDDEEEVKSIADPIHCFWCHLADHSVECIRGHGGDRDTLCTGAGIKDLGGNDPRQRAAGR